MYRSLQLCFLLLFTTTSFAFVLKNKKSQFIKPMPLSLNNGDLPSNIIKETTRNGVGDEWTYNNFLQNLLDKNIESVSIFDNNKGFVAIDNKHSEAVLPSNIHLIKTIPNMIDDVVSKLNLNHINYDILVTNNNNNPLTLPLQFIGGYFAVTLLLNFVVNFARNNGQTPMNGRSQPSMFNNLNPFGQNTNIVDTESIDVDFGDVAGCDEAKYELMEVVDFLKNPLKYSEAGAKIPRGILLEGQPGTGKTLLARAVAGEAGVSFLSASGSEFIEMFVGVGASRVRKLFDSAEENSPCVIFIDEIDAVGRQRGAGINTGNDEREQTLNQILTNMDGFTGTSGIIVLAATNRADILDKALLRPGRFDRKVTVPLPGLDGRKEIFKVHTKNKILDNDTNIEEIGVLTSGFSGADICNLANEAAILSVRYNRTSIDRKTLLDAYEKITIGLPTISNNENPDIIKLVAHHEIGHALVAKYFEEFFVLRKVTINANTGGAGGYTLFTPKEKYISYATKKFMLANIIVALGGRAAEVQLFSNNTKKSTDIVFKNIDNLDITSGASNDLKQADNIARKYISLFGISDHDMMYNDIAPNTQPFLGRELGVGGDRTSEYTKEIIDKKVYEIINDCYDIALNLINYNLKSFYGISNLLIEKRILDNSHFENIELEYY
tara:strand:- start:25002 stop:26996 length:1995 start_codon:yes stop_codon:yes gene_type:complete